MWGELLRKLKVAGFVEQRRGKGGHRQFIHPESGRVITVGVHTKQAVGAGLARRILKESVESRVNRGGFPNLGSGSGSGRPSW